MAPGHPWSALRESSTAMPTSPTASVPAASPRFLRVDRVYRGAMTRTTIDLDDALVELAMRLHRLESKEAVVRLALEQLVGASMSTDEILAMDGSGFPFTNDELERLFG